MESLEAFVKYVNKQGKDEADKLVELQRILDELDTCDKPVYFIHDTVVNK